MNREQRIRAFSKVGGFLRRHLTGATQPPEAILHEGFDKIIETAHSYNNWFIPNFVKEAVQGISTWLTEAELEKLLAGRETAKARTVAIICAGNIPMVGFHDIMCTLLAGHKALIRLSSDDKALIPFLLKLLCHYEPGFEKQYQYAEQKVTGFDAVIATGSNNTAVHFEYYFGKYPRIIRRSRTSVAVLDGTETQAELKLLAKDIFLYFGLGCRNVSKLLVPQDYTFDFFFESLIDYAFVINNNKYGNNYDYNRAIYLLSGDKFLDNNFLLLKEDAGLFSPVAVLFYERFGSAGAVEDYLLANGQNLQCIVGKNRTPFGYSQQPVITEFADNTDTLAFLVNL
jgi:hypothetical protein